MKEIGPNLLDQHCSIILSISIKKIYFSHDNVQISIKLPLRIDFQVKITRFQDNCIFNLLVIET